MEISLLGTFRARTGGASFAPSAHKPRQLLALLAVHAGQLIPVGTMVEELWGARATPKAHLTVQTYVRQLRTGLAGALGSREAARQVLATRPGGYTLLPGGAVVDVHEYDRLTAAAQAAAEAGDDPRTAELFRRALALWRGPAFSGVPRGAVLGIEAMRLERSRTDAAERCISAELRLGAHERLVPELAELTARHPHNEALHVLFMAALERSGRPERALAVYERVRARLDEEFGLLPSPGLRRLGREVRERALGRPMTA